MAELGVDEAPRFRLDPMVAAGGTASPAALRVAPILVFQFALQDEQLFAAGYAAWHFGVRGDPLTVELLAKSLAAAVFVWALIALAVIDLDTQMLPDSITYPLLWAGIGLGFFGLFAGDLKAAVLGAILGYLSLWSIYWAFRLITGKEGMGYGDFKLLAALGAWMGWQALPLIILISSALGALIGVTMIVTGFIKRSEPIPFGPYLALAGIVALFWEQALARLFTGSVVL